MNKRKGFTLIELLVVIAIIALLMSILMPALAKVREQAKKIRCQAQMRQYGFAINMYANDNRGAIPFFDKAFNGGVIDANTAWYGVCGTYMGIKTSGSLAESKAAILAKARRCPSGKPDNSPAYNAVDHWKGWIGVNYGAWNYAGFPAPAPFVYGKTDMTANATVCDPILVSSVKHPSSWMMLLDVVSWFVYTPALTSWHFNDDWDFDRKDDTCAGTTMIYNGANPRVHSDGCNIVLVDGHIEWIAFKELWKYDNNMKMTHPYWFNK